MVPILFKSGEGVVFIQFRWAALHATTQVSFSLSHRILLLIYNEWLINFQNLDNLYLTSNSNIIAINVLLLYTLPVDSYLGSLYISRLDLKKPCVWSPGGSPCGEALSLSLSLSLMQITVNQGHGPIVKCAEPQLETIL